MNINTIKVFCVALAIGTIFIGCNDWTETEAVDFYKIDLNETNKTDEYYASLREWKNTPDLPHFLYTKFPGFINPSQSP